MWLKLKLDGVLLRIQISNYRRLNQDNWDELWCTTEFSLCSEPWLNYTTGGELLLSGELDELSKALDDLLHDRIGSPTEFPCVEPDFCFVLNPKKNLHLDPRCTHVQRGCEIEDINLEWRVSFWSGGGLSSNYLTLTLDRKDIEQLYNYLNVVTGVLRSDAPEVLRLIREDVFS